MSKERKKWQKKQVPPTFFSFFIDLCLYLATTFSLPFWTRAIQKLSQKVQKQREKEDDHAWSHDRFVRRIRVFGNGNTRWSHLSSRWVSKDSSFCRRLNSPPPPRPPRLRILYVFLVHPLLCFLFFFYLFCLLEISTLFLFFSLDCKITLPSNVKRCFLSFKIQECSGKVVFFDFSFLGLERWVLGNISRWRLRLATRNRAYYSVVSMERCVVDLFFAPREKRKNMCPAPSLLNVFFLKLVI